MTILNKSTKVETLSNNKLLWLLNKRYAVYENQIIGNEFGIFYHIIITQFRSLTNTVNR